MRKKIGLGLMVLFILGQGSCATISTETYESNFEQADITEPFPPYDGEKARIQVIRFEIPRDVVEKYPELADKQVGFGLTNRLIDTFYESRRFTFVEEKEEILQRILDQWKLSLSGIVVEEQQITGEGLSVPQYLVYAEIYEFSVRYGEKIVGLAQEKTGTTLIGVQLRVVDVASGEYIPASGLGEASSIAESVWVSPSLPFDQSTVGLATEKAVRKAVRNLMDRL